MRVWGDYTYYIKQKNNERQSLKSLFFFFFESSRRTEMGKQIWRWCPELLKALCIIHFSLYYNHKEKTEKTYFPTPPTLINNKYLIFSVCKFYECLKQYQVRKRAHFFLLLLFFAFTIGPKNWLGKRRTCSAKSPGNYAKSAKTWELWLIWDARVREMYKNMFIFLGEIFF